MSCSGQLKRKKKDKKQDDQTAGKVEQAISQRGLCPPAPFQQIQMTHSAAAAQLFCNCQQLQQLLDKNTIDKCKPTRQLQITHARLRYSVTLIEHS